MHTQFADVFELYEHEISLMQKELVGHRPLRKLDLLGYVLGHFQAMPHQ